MSKPSLSLSRYPALPLSLSHRQSLFLFPHRLFREIIRLISEHQEAHSRTQRNEISLYRPIGANYNSRLFLSIIYSPFNITFIYRRAIF